jgi:glycerol kinase
VGKFILSIDQGTTATTVLLVDEAGTVRHRASKEILPTYPEYGWVEHDLAAIERGTWAAIAEVSSRVSPADIVAVGITNQRETVGAWDRKSGAPLGPAIVWQCRRTAQRCAELAKDKTLASRVLSLTGLVLDPYFSGSKIEWLLKNNPQVRASVESGTALFGTIDSFLLYRLTGNSVHGTEPSNASRTMLMNLKSGAWEKELLELFSVPTQCLPKIFDSSGLFGHTKGVPGLLDGTPITGILGDQQSALLGQLCFAPGEAKLTYGTGAFLMAQTGDSPVFSKNGLLTTVAWRMKGKTFYALEGSAFVAGAAVQFLRDNLGLIKSSTEIESLASQVSEDEIGDLIFVPSLTGLGAPYWLAEAKGMIYGLTRGTRPAHIARATLEGIALQNQALLLALREDMGKPLSVLRVDGGAAANNLLMQLQSDLGELSLERPLILDTTALGAAFAAGMGIGLWSNESTLRASWKLDRRFEPKMDPGKRSLLWKKWNSAVARVRGS